VRGVVLVLQSSQQQEVRGRLVAWRIREVDAIRSRWNSPNTSSAIAG
jgi:hypothetical protein